MPQTLIQQLAEFSIGTTYDHLPPEVIHECKRALVDSIGCGLAGGDEPKGKAGIDYARVIGGGQSEATILGVRGKFSVLGAAFANGELISALDMDAILPPGHVSPYVIPAAAALAESTGAGGRRLIAALAVSHEMSNRFGRAMDNQRRIVNGKIDPPPVFGYASSIFGATAAIGVMRGHSPETLANALGIAACISPVNSQISWFEHAPSTTIKYLMAGMLAQQALTAAYMGEFGHRGDIQVLDDREFGYPRFIGTQKWDPTALLDQLGTRWQFPNESSYKPYPHCRIMHGMMDCVIKAVRDNDLKPHEIDAIKVYVEGIAERPCWLNREIGHVQDAQFSMAHGISVAAHLVPPGKEWQSPKVVYDPSVMSLMDRITTEVHPDYATAITAHSASRPARVEVTARGRTIVEEKLFPKGSPSTDPASYMSDAELDEKFRHNAAGVLSPAATDELLAALWKLDACDNVAPVMALAARSAG